MPTRLARLFVLITVAIDSIGIGLIFPVMPDLLTGVLGADLATAAVWGGLLTAAFGLMQFLFGPVVGNLSDRYGRRPVLLISLLVMALDYLVMAVANTIWLLLAARVVAGIAASTHVTASAFMADITPPSGRGRAFGLIGAAFGIGFVAGPAIGGLLGALDPRAPFWAAAAIAAANLAFGLVVLPETLGEDRRRPFTWARANPLAAFRAIGRLPGLGRLLALHFTYTVAFYVYPAVWAYFGQARFGWEAGIIGFSLALFGLCNALVQAFGVGPAIRVWGERGTALRGMLVDTGALVAFGFLTSGFWALVVTPISAVGGVAGPALAALQSNATPDDQQGELQGVLAALAAIATTLSPLVMTQVFAAFTRPGAPVFAPGGAIPSGRCATGRLRGNPCRPPARGRPRLD
jgi:DHA1 family tetracycline resistance protein-like MFS transporter